MRTFLLPLFVMLAVLAAACGGDSDDGDVAGPIAATAAPTPEPEAGDDGAPAEAETEDDDGAGNGEASDGADDGNGDDGGADAAEPAELTATARGVTADTITIGVGVTDVNVFAPTGDILARFQPLADATNAAGGINGRQIELVTEQWDVLDATAFDASCIALTEDDEVFLVLGFLIDGFSNVPCYTDIHGTLVINTTLLQSDDLEISEGLLLTTRPDELASLIAGLRLLGPELEGAKVAVYSGAGDERPGIISELLVELGAEVVEITEQQISGSEDLTAAAAEVDIHIERWQVAGADWIVNVDGSVAASLAGIQRAGLTDLNIVSPANLVPSNTALGADLSMFPNLVATGPPNLDQVAVDGLYGVPECIDLVNDGTGQGITPFPPEGEDDQVATTVEVCAAWDIFVALATAAGPDLTPESFLQAGYDLGEFPMTGSISGSVAPGKPYVSNAPGALYVYDAEADTFVAR